MVGKTVFELWLFGGTSYNGSYCGLAYSFSNSVWPYSNVTFSSRLAYYGPLNRVTTSRFKQLAS